MKELDSIIEMLGSKEAVAHLLEVDARTIVNYLKPGYSIPTRMQKLIRLEHKRMEANAKRRIG